MLKKMKDGEYEYLNKEDSNLYDEHKDKQDETSKLIIRLLERIASASRGAHCASLK